MKFKLPFVHSKSKGAAPEPRTIATDNQPSPNIVALARKVKQDMDARERQIQKDKVRRDLQEVTEKLNRTEKEKKKKEEARALVSRLQEGDKMGHVLSVHDGYRAAIIKALTTVRREGFEMLRLFSQHGKYDFEDMGSLFQLFEDYCLRKDRYPMLPVTPNQVVDTRISRAYHSMLANLNRTESAAVLGVAECETDASRFWHNSRDFKAYSGFPNGMCMCRDYKKPTGRLDPITLEDIWVVTDTRAFLNPLHS